MEKKVAQVLKPTSRATNEGFTLLEIMIVIALIALVTAIMAPGFTGIFRTSNESFVKQTAMLLKDARDRALLTDKLVRLRLDLDKQEFWLEEAPSSYLLPKTPDRPLDQRAREEADKKEESAYRMLSELTKEKRSVPKGLKLMEVISPRAKNPIKEGMSDVFFYPNGNADGAVLHFESEEKTQQTLLLHPITGQSKVVPGFITQENQ